MNKEELQLMLKEAGVEFHHMLGVEKLLALAIENKLLTEGQLVAIEEEKKAEEERLAREEEEAEKAKQQAKGKVTTKVLSRLNYNGDVYEKGDEVELTQEQYETLSKDNIVE